MLRSRWRFLRGYSIRRAPWASESYLASPSEPPSALWPAASLSGSPPGRGWALLSASFSSATAVAPPKAHILAHNHRTGGRPGSLGRGPMGGLLHCRSSHSKIQPRLLWQRLLSLDAAVWPARCQEFLHIRPALPQAPLDNGQTTPSWNPHFTGSTGRSSPAIWF